MLEELQRLLAETRLSHRELSDLSGVSLSLIHAIKDGTRPNPTINTYQALRRELLKAAKPARKAA